jgi:hypothetical protein
MRHGVVAALFAMALPLAAAAQGAPESFKDTQREGLRLFSQSSAASATPSSSRGPANTGPSCRARLSAATRS